MTAKKARRDAKKTGSQRVSTTHAVRATGMATAVMAGAFVMAATAPQATAPQATADASTPVTLATSSSSLQSAIDQLLAAEQAAAAQDSAVPFATPGNMALLPGALRNLEFQQLMLATHSLFPSNPFLNLYGVTSQNAADTRQFTELDTDGHFYWITNALDPDASYVVSGNFNNATSTQLLLDNIGARGSTQIGILESGQGLVINPDGTYTVDIGPTEPSGAVNYLDDTGANYFLIKSFMGPDGPSSVHIQCVADCPEPTPGVTSTGISPSAITSVLNKLAGDMPRDNAISTALAKSGGILEPDNTMSDIAQHGIIGENEANLSSNGQFDLQPDQALIVRMPETTTNIMLYNAWGQMLPFPLSETNFNTTTTDPFQPFQASDGYTYYVISAANPGVANWLDTGGLQNGEIGTNVVSSPDIVGDPVQTEVVPVADVNEYLPADTPTVRPEEYAATMASRVLSYYHAMDFVRTSDPSNWVTEELWLRDIQAVMGIDNFHEAFGEQPSTPMWLRLTPALSPEWTTVAKDFLTNPSGSLSALMNTLAIAGKDIELPIKLAETLLQQDFTQTAEAVQSAISSGDLQGALTTLATGGQQLGSILNEALFDPSTSITAGIFNARDDLATAVMTATKGGFPTELGPLAAWEWEHMSQLTQLTPGTALADLGSLFDPTGGV
jgi:hypothetical protein